MHIKYVEFHITNVCDISCNNCNKFNNFNLKGSFRWNDVSSIYERWASILTFDEITIVGGEPLTNPDLPNWIAGIRRLWPDARLAVATNGVRLSKSPDAIRAMRENSVRLRLSIHAVNLHEKIMEDLDDLLIKPVKKNIEYLPHNMLAWKQSYDSIKADSWQACDHPDDFANLPAYIQKECDGTFNFSKDKFDTYEAMTELTDSTGFVVDILWYTQFHEAALTYEQGSFKLRNSDPEKAINNCDQKFCHSFKDGKLYKCAVAHALPDAITQFKIPISTEDQQAIDEFAPAEIGWDISTLEGYVANLKDAAPISMCRFCPEVYNTTPIGDVSKKRY